MKRCMLAVAVVTLLAANANHTVFPRSPEQPPDSLYSVTSKHDARPIIPGLRYSVAKITTRDGQIWTGLFAGILGDSLILMDGTVRVALPFRELAHVHIRNEETSQESVIPTLLVGSMGIMLVAGQAYGQPVGYINEMSNAGRILGSLMGGVALASVAAAVERGADPADVECTFSDDPAVASASWDDLQRRVRGVPLPDFVHIALQASHVATRMSHAETGSGSYPMWGYATNWNLLRRVQLTFSVTPFLQVGAAMIRIAEPTISVGGGWSGGTASEHWAVEESFSEGNLYGLAGVVEPPPGILPEWLVLRGGGAFGPVTIEYMNQRTVYTYQYVPPYSSSAVQHSEQFDGTELGFGIYGEVGVNITSLVSLSCIVDYCAVPSKKFPAIPELKLPEETLGNSSVGVLIGFHF